MSADILVIDPDIAFTQQLKNCLESESFKVTLLHDGKNGVKKALNQPFDAIILDILLPQLNGFEVLKAIREHLDIPVLMLTARQDDIDRLVSFEIGADDYLSKPCNPNELIARLRGILKRVQKLPTHKPLLEFHHISVDCNKRMVSIANKPLELTNAEFNILEMLMKSPDQAFSKEELTEYALGRKYTAYDRSIDVHISNLRNKLGEKGEDIIKTVRGFGYLFKSVL